MTKRSIALGTVQETLLVPLYGRAVESRKPKPALRDDKATQIVGAIDYDFARFDELPSLLGTVLRTSLLDRWNAAFLAEYPTGTVVEPRYGAEHPVRASRQRPWSTWRPPGSLPGGTGCCPSRW